MEFWILVLKYNTVSDIIHIIRDLIKHKNEYSKLKVKTEYLILTFTRMSIKILNNAWSTEISRRVKDIQYIMEFVNYLAELESRCIFKGDNEVEFLKFCDVYGDYYGRFLDEVERDSR